MVFLGAWLIGRASAAAQAPVDSTLQRTHLDAAGLRGGQFVYQFTLERDTGSTTLGTRTVGLSETTYAGAPAWLLVETRSGDGIAAADSLVAGRADLHPIHWSSTQGAARLAAEFAGDSVFGVTSSPLGKRSFAAAVPAGAIVNAAALETRLRLLALQSGWRDSTASLSLSYATTTILPTQLAVTGEETVRAPAGVFDCWVVTATADIARATYWVSKRDPVVVRSVQVLPALGGARVVSTLTTRVP